MRMYDIVMDKKEGKPLSDAQIRYVVEGYTKGDIPDYQVSAWLMAICLNGMQEHETAVLTDAMARSGDMTDLSAIPGIKVDKHSTGGVGDKTSLIVGPIVAACGVPVAKMSGRGLGHTGGTLDKLESIPGFQTALERERFLDIVRTVGISIIGQTGNIAPADKKLYALRDVTATVDSVPLIASSIMSKKLAAGADAILLDVKTGDGAFMKTLADSITLAQAMVSIGEHMGRATVALITDMDRPLGNAIGNALEVQEVVQALHMRGPADLEEVCLALAADMLFLAGKGDPCACMAQARFALESGLAFTKLCEMVQAQGGDIGVLQDPERFTKAHIVEALPAPCSGYISRIQTETCGHASMLLGAGRERKEDVIDYSAGMLLCKKPGDAVCKGEPLAWLHTASTRQLTAAQELLQGTFEIAQIPPPCAKRIYARVTRDGVQQL